MQLLMLRRAARFGAAAALSTGSLAAADQLTLVSPNEQTAGQFGFDVAGLPDCDGDGVDDFIVSAPGEVVNGLSNAGRVYVYSGASGLLIRTHIAPAPAVNLRYGTAIAGLADADGDGRGDYVITMPIAGAGAAEIRSGATGALIQSLASPNPEPEGRFGEAVCGLDDVNGDGLADLIIGAPLEDDFRGRAYVFSGLGVLLRTHTSPDSQFGGQFGLAVTSIPDRNLDGVGDYAVGAPYEDTDEVDAGQVHVFSGQSGAVAGTIEAPESQGSARFGTSICGVADADGDGRGEILVGAPFEDVMIESDTFDDAGRAYLFDGGALEIDHVYTLEPGEITIGSLFGRDVAGLDDRNGDGAGDVIIGAPGWPTLSAYVYSAAAPHTDLQTFPTPDPIGANQFFGSAVAAIGDANADGKTDFIVGGRGSDDFPNGPAGSGRGYVDRSFLSNDFCTVLSAPMLSEGVNPFTVIGAGGDAEGGIVCSDVIGADVWFRYTADCDGPVTFTTCDSGFDTVLEIYEGCANNGPPFFFCDLSMPIACNNDSFPCDDDSIVTVAAMMGDCFFVRVGGYLDAEGAGVINISCEGVCDADLDGDQFVGPADLAILLSNWGTGDNGDIDQSGVVDATDLARLLAAWGPC